MVNLLESFLGLRRSGNSYPVKTEKGAGCRAHYIWVCAAPFTPTPDQSFPVPPNSFGRAINNALSYPDAEICLWFDPRFIAQDVFQAMNEHIRSRGCTHVQICSLLSVPAYADNPHFAPGIGAPNPKNHREKGFDVYARADLTKIEVLNADLVEGLPEDNTQERPAYVFLADWDIPDIALDRPSIQKILDQYGMAFGRAESNVLENQYFAYKRNKVDKGYFQDLLASSRRAFESGYHNYGFLAFGDSLVRWCRRYNENLPEKKRLYFFDHPNYIGARIPAITAHDVRLHASGVPDSALAPKRNPIEP